MDKTAFLGSEEAWWLLEPDLPPTLEDLRRDLGAAFEWRYDLWYTEPLRIEALYEWIERNSYQLLSELDTATDELKRQAWLESLLEAVRPPEGDPSASAEAEAGAGAGTAAPAAPAATTGTAPPRKSIFARKEAAAAADDDAGGSAGPAAAAGAEAAPAAAATKAAPAAAPPAEAPSMFARKRAAEAAPAAGPPEATAAAAPATVEEVQAAVSALSPDEVTGLADDLGMDGDELNALLADPAFQALVAEEGAKLS
jgi:hypothetical protein